MMDPNLAAGYPTVTPIGESLLSAVILTPTPSAEAQAGGQEVPPASSTPTQVAQPTQTSVPATATPEAVVEEPTEEPADDDPPASTGEGVAAPGGDHEIVLVATEEVWVQVSLDWNPEPDYESTLQAGESVRFVADVATISSGNAGYVEVYVDGVAWGILSSTWDDTVTLP
jgi:hypothetical protein